MLEVNNLVPEPFNILQSSAFILLVITVYFVVKHVELLFSYRRLQFDGWIDVKVLSTM
jgi:hypothetical protein